MNVKATNKVETNRYELELEVSSEEFNEAINTVYKRESKKMNIPGFRKGHAPRAFIEKYYGEEVFYEAAIDHLYRPMVMEAVEKSGLQVISIGEFKIDEIGKDKGILCKLNVVTKPEATIEGYKGIEVTHPLQPHPGTLLRSLSPCTSWHCSSRCPSCRRPLSSSS